MQTILLVRLTSMGDIIHNFPAVTDLAKHYPSAKIDWLVNQDFADLPALHPHIHTVIACAERQWRRQPFSNQTWREIQHCRTQLRQTPYDLVIDSQGLIKSAWLSSLTKRPIAGYDINSIKERLATYFYTYDYSVPWRLDAITRNRKLTGLACGYLSEGPVDYGIPTIEHRLNWLPQKKYVVFLTATSQVDKQWPANNWIHIGNILTQLGFEVVLPWGSLKEYDSCKALSLAFPAIVPPKLSLKDAAYLLQKAQLAIGVDTGLTHLAAAVNTPVIMLFCASNPRLTGVQSQNYFVNLGQAQSSPSTDIVIEYIRQAISSC